MIHLAGMRVVTRQQQMCRITLNLKHIWSLSCTPCLWCGPLLGHCFKILRHFHPARFFISLVCCHH
uniref:Uncharacterized protein n=1 Tax=Arundo donax TaxID=35708 RepID=A0A0A9D805_ARUDO